ncbi:MAG: hypothetical protein V1796_01315 [Pseudomonadota bacterium]
MTTKKRGPGPKKAQAIELARRRSAHRPLKLQAERGYAKLYMKSVLQAEQGCDFDFLRKV